MSSLLENRDNLIAREAMACANTLAGLCIANVGLTLPHGIGTIIGHPQFSADFRGDGRLK